MVAVYFLEPSICMVGGAENCLGAVDTGAPWAAGEAEVDAAVDGEAAGLGKGLSALETWADDGGVVDGRVGLEVGAAGAAFRPQAAKGKTNRANNTA